MPEVINFDHMYHELAGLLGTPQMARRMLVKEEVNGVNGILVKYRVNFNVEIKDAFTGYEGKLLDHVEKHIETLKLKGKSKLVQKDQLEWIQHALIEVKELSLDPHSNKQQPIGPNDQVFVGETRTPAAESALQQDRQGQSHGEGSMLTDDNLANDAQKELCRNLKSAIESGSYKTVFGGKLAVDIKAVLGTRIIEDGFEHNFLTYAIKHNSVLAAIDILDSAKSSSLKNLLNDRPIIGTYKGKDDMDMPYDMTALEYAQEQKNEEFEQLIIKYMGFERMPVPDRQNLPPLDEDRPASSETSATSAIPSLLQQDGHSQGPEEDDIDLYDGLINAINANDLQKIDVILNIKNQGFLKTLLSMKETITYEGGREERHTALSYAQEQRCTDLANKIREKMRELGLKVSEQTNQSPVNLGATPATLPHILQGGQHQQGRTDGLYLREDSISSESSDDKGEHQGASKTPAFWDEDEHQSAPKTPTFWDKNKGKIAVGTIGASLLIGGIITVLVAANPTVVAFAIAAAVLGAIMLVGALAKTTDKGEEILAKASDKLSGLLVSKKPNDSYIGV